MFYAYILRSNSQEGAIYIGSTSDLKKRLITHNTNADANHVKKYQPWTVESYFAFSNKIDAEKFEKYLKSNSGKAFLRKRLISSEFKEAVRKFNNGRGERKVSETE